LSVLSDPWFVSLLFEVSAFETRLMQNKNPPASSFLAVGGKLLKLRLNL